MRTHLAIALVMLAGSSLTCHAGSGAGTASFGDGGTETNTESGRSTTGDASHDADADADADGAMTGRDPIFDVGPSPSDSPGGVPQTCADAEAQQGAAGCSFWAVDLPNTWDGDYYDWVNGLIPQEQQFAVVIANNSAEQFASVEVFLGAEVVPLQAAMIGVGELHTFLLPAQNIDPLATGVGGTAYRFASDVPVTAYQFQPIANIDGVFSNDASLLFPAHVLTGDYVAVTGDASLLYVKLDTEENSGAFVSVVATEDDTTIDLYATATLYPGTVLGVVLDRGEILTAISVGSMQYPGVPNDGNLSGTRVHADKPVAVFAGNVSTREPATEMVCCADHMEHQIPPVSTWGTAYAAAPPSHPWSPDLDAPAVYRLTGAFEGTNLAYSPARPDGAPDVVGAYETVTFLTAQAFSVHAMDATKSFALTQFLVSATKVHDLNEDGDPSMIVLPSVEQWQRSYVLLVPEGYVQNYATLVATAAAEIEIDGAPIDMPLRPMGQLDGEALGFAHVALDPGPHVITADLVFGVVLAGYAETVSYGYPGGTGLATIGEVPSVPAG